MRLIGYIRGVKWGIIDAKDLRPVTIDSNISEACRTMSVNSTN